MKEKVKKLKVEVGPQPQFNKYISIGFIFVCVCVVVVVVVGRILAHAHAQTTKLQVCHHTNHPVLLFIYPYPRREYDCLSGIAAARPHLLNHLE